MPRRARFVLPGHPHHVTQRGNRGARTFFEAGDYARYLELLAAAARTASVEIWSYCLMPNHVHIIATPTDEAGLGRTFANVHRHYSAYINARLGMTGGLWQGRFRSVAMDDMHLVYALRYVALNPVRAQLVAKAEDWRWSSVRAHLAGVDDNVVRVAPTIARVGNFGSFLGENFDERLNYAALRQAEHSGRPLGSAQWIRGQGDTQ